MTVQRIKKAIARRYNKAILHAKAYFSFRADLRELKRQIPPGTDFPITGYMPILLDKYEQNGSFTTHYFEQDLLMAQRIFNNNPDRHVDIGSRVSGFITHVAAFRPIEVLDIRQMDRKITNVIFKQADLMKLPPELVNYTSSISSLHAIEHFGLGRYGDPIDVNGHFKALDNIHLILKPGGKFYFSVPVGKQGIRFNAHRLFAVGYLVKLLEKRYRIDHFYFIDDNDKLYRDKDPHAPEAAFSFGADFGCAMFELTKL